MPLLGVGCHISNPTGPDVPKVAWVIAHSPRFNYSYIWRLYLEQTLDDCSIIDSQLLGRPVAN